MAPAEVLDELVREIAKHSYRFVDEAELQRGLATVLTKAAIPFEREYRLSARDRPDFLVRGCVAIEVKIGASTASLTRQVHRYTQHEQVKAVLVVASRLRLANMPAEFNGRPLRVHVVMPGLL